jgi:hypothetical protein
MNHLDKLVSFNLPGHRVVLYLLLNIRQDINNLLVKIKALLQLLIDIQKALQTINDVLISLLLFLIRSLGLFNLLIDSYT